MTAPAHPDRQGTREELAAAIHDADDCPVRCSGEPHARHYRYADALLPVVERQMIRYGDQRAAEALEEAANDLGHLGREHAAVDVRRRAAALRAKP